MCKTPGITQQGCHRWRKEYGELRVDRANRHKQLQKESLRLKKVVADQALDRATLKDIAEPDF